MQPYNPKQLFLSSFFWCCRWPMKAAVERAMKVQEVILRAVAKKITGPGASALLAFSPALVGDASHAFAQSHQLIGGDAFVRLVQSVGPVDINIDRSDFAQAKVQA